MRHRGPFSTWHTLCCPSYVADDLAARARALAATIRDRYGVTVSVGALPADATPGRVLAFAAEVAAQLGGHRRLDDAPPPPWTPLPAARWSSSPCDRERAVRRLEAWAIERGARFDAIELCVDYTGHVTARARRELAAGERVITVPERLLLTPDVLMAREGRAVRGALARCWPAEALSVLLPLEHARATTPWRPVLDAMPPALAGTAHGRPDLGELAGTGAWNLAVAACRRLVALHRGLAPDLAARLPLGALAWGHGIVRSRAFALQDRRGWRCAIVPIIDMLDHREGEARLDHDAAASAWTVTTMRAFAAGEPVHLAYGPLGNGRLLVDYGFTLPVNPHDLAEVVFPPADDPRVEVAAHLLWNAPLGRPASIVVSGRFDRHLARALSIARLRAGPFEGLAGAFLGGEVAWLGDEVEERALALVAAAARAGLARLRPTPAEPGDAGGRWRRACDRVRRGEQAVLERVQVFAHDPDDAPDELAQPYAWTRP